MVSISTISNTTQTVSTANSTAAASTTTAQTTTVATPTITTTNSSTVKVSAAALSVAKAATATPTPLSVAQILATGDKIPAGTVIKDTAANISTSLKALGALTSIANVTSITLSDTKAGTIAVARTDLMGDLSDPQNTDLNLAVLKKITSSYTLNVSGLSASDALTLKAPAKIATLSLSINDSVDNITTNLTALQTAAKAKSIAGIAITPASAGTPKPNLTISAAQLKASPELLATIKGDYDLTITGVAAADAVTVAGNADKVLKASGSQSTQSKVAISDTAANLVKSIAALETAATAGRLTSITVSDSKALVLTEAQIKADSHFLATQFTSNTSIEATVVAAADFTTVQSLVNANSKLTLTKESIADTAANIQSNLDALEAEVKTGGTTPTLTTPATPTISPTPPVPLGPNQVYNPANGHVYEYVTESKTGDAAEATAEAKSYNGWKGYLATVTSQDELNFIENSVLPNQNNTPNVIIGGHLVTGKQNTWEWEGGPEKGIQFWDNGPINGQFANWNTQNGYPKTSGSESQLTLNSYFVPQFSATPDSHSYLIEYSPDNLIAPPTPTPAPTPKPNPIISSITATDKGSITVTNSTLVNDIDALKVLTGKYTLNVTDIGVSDALALKAPSKDATLSISVKDTAANIAANWDKLQAAVKAKTLTSITVTDSASSLLTMTAAQLKADTDALKVVTGDYKLSVTGVAAADVAKTLTTKNIYSVEVKDTAANILKNLTSIQTAVTAAKIQNVVITDATNPSLSISDIFALTTTLPNVTLATGIKFNVKDTANMIIAHARDDIRDVLKNAGSVTLTDKTPPNLTLADAITLKGIANLDKTTKYNVTDGGTLMAAQAAISGETILSGAASVSINKNFTIADAKAVTGIKTLAKGTVYSIADTADNVLTQSAVAGDKILAGANSVTVVDTSANIIAKLDQLEVLAKAGKIADIKFTDTPISALNITNDQLLKDAEAIGKIISQRTLPTLSVSKPTTPAPLIVVTAPTIQYPDSTLNNTTPTFSGTTSPNTTVNIYENDILLGTTNATSNGNWFIPVTTPLSYGSHTIKAVAIDANGVKSDFAIKSINIVQYTTSIRFPNAQTDNSTPTFSGYTETGSIVKLFENDILLGSTNSTSDGSWYITPTTPLSVGSHTVVAKSFDSTGKQLTTDTKTVTITQSQKPISNLSFVQTTISLGPNGNFPHDVAAADLTGSGYKDIIVGCEFSKNLIIFNNNKDGSFTKGLTLQSDHPLFTPVVADLQKNGSKSIIATGGGVISIFTPQPDGSYIESQVPGASGYRVSSADVNGDGYPDLITSNAVFLNNKNGSFTKSFNFNISGDGNDIKAKDFTGDGLPDVVISNFGQPANFFKNNGDGTFTGPQNLGSNTMDVDFGDLNGDGKLDIVTANQDGTVQIFNNDGNGNFTEGSKINVGSRPGFVIVADINNDGKNDIVVANQGGECLAYVLNDGNGNFSNPINPGNSKFSYGFTVADLNNDGKLDIITANPSDNSISIYKNTGV